MNRALPNFPGAIPKYCLVASAFGINHPLPPGKPALAFRNGTRKVPTAQNHQSRGNIVRFERINERRFRWFS